MTFSALLIVGLFQVCLTAELRPEVSGRETLARSRGGKKRKLPNAPKGRKEGRVDNIYVLPLLYFAGPRRTPENLLSGVKKTKGKQIVLFPYWQRFFFQHSVQGGWETLGGFGLDPFFWGGAP